MKIDAFRSVGSQWEVREEGTEEQWMKKSFIACFVNSTRRERDARLWRQ